MKNQRNQPSGGTKVNRTGSIVLSLAFALLAAIPARAATRYWDADTATAHAKSGNGTWNAGVGANTNWATAVVSGSNVAWDNATPDSAYFSTALSAVSSTLTLGSDITAGIITYGNYAVTIQNSVGNTYSLTLNGVSIYSIEQHSGTLTIDVPVVMKSGAGFYRINSPGGTLIINGVITETGGAWSMNASESAVYLNGLNEYTGTAVAGGSHGTANRLYINTLKLKGEAQSTGKNNTIQFGAFESKPFQHLIYTGGATTTDKDWRLGGTTAAALTVGAGFLNNGTGAVVWQGAQQQVTIGATGARTLILGGTNTDDNDWKSVIKNGYASGTSHNISLTKQDAGKWILSGNNTYSGPTTISNGTLVINGNQSGATGTVTVASGAALGGTGTVGGAVTLATGGKLMPGDTGGAVPSKLTIAGAFTYENGTLDLSGLTSVAGGTHELATFPSRSVSTFASIVGLPSGATVGYTATAITLTGPPSGTVIMIR